MSYNIAKKKIKSSLYLSALISFLFLLVTFSYGQNDKNDSDTKILQLINQLEDKTLEKRQEAVLNIYALGKDAVPELISNITNTKSLPFLLKNPRNSMLSSSQLYNSSGICSAYLIELILGKKDFTIDEKDGEYFIFGNSENYIYWEGIIVDSKGKSIEQKHLNEIKLQYEKYWTENKDKNLETLRNEWAEGKKPLSQSKYKWQ